MNFLEKDLETIIWESADECESRGLDILQMNSFKHGRRFRQMQLGPYGIADLVNIYYDPWAKCVYIQVIECKRGKVNGDTYLQAKRYVSAVEQLLYDTPLRALPFHFTTVLVGDSVDTSGPMAHVVAKDIHCYTYTYKYAVDGIRFHDSRMQWSMESWVDLPEHVLRMAPALAEYYHDENALKDKFLVQYGDYANPLLLTSSGVQLNHSLFQA